MELIRTLSQMVNCLRSRGIRRKVAVVCPNDPHTEYVIIRSLREEIAEYLLVTDSAHLKEALDLRALLPTLYAFTKLEHRMKRLRWLCNWYVRVRRRS